MAFVYTALVGINFERISIANANFMEKTHEDSSAGVLKFGTKLLWIAQKFAKRFFLVRSVCLTKQ